MGHSAKWIGRATSIPTRVCVIPRCQAAATATLRTDPSSPRAWLVDLDAKPIDAGASSGEDLCTRHADALAPGEGWVLHDERRRRTGANQSIERARRPRPAGASARPDSRLDLRRPGHAESVDQGVDDMLDARSPLLRRAFAKSRDT
jgi:hypothetical protein